MSGHTEGSWTVYEFVENAIEGDSTQAGLYEVEEANEEILDLIATGEHEKARAKAKANRAFIQAAPAYREAWGMVPEKYRKAALEVLPPWVREAVKATGGDPGDEDAEREARVEASMSADDAIALTVECPECGALPTRDCADTHSRMRLAHCHSYRRTAAIRAKAEGRQP